MTDNSAWERFTHVMVVTAIGVLGAVLVLAYLVDPYDTGRSTVFSKPGVRPQGPRTAAASRGRDPAFNATVIGNSHVQLLSPERLKGKTGLDFVQLSLPDSRPKEQFALVEWFLRNHGQSAQALVIGADLTWCTSDPALTNHRPFPFWLYSPNALEYARGLLRFDILEELLRRLAYVLDDEAERARPDGYWDYEPDYKGLGYADNSVLREQLEQQRGEGGSTNLGPFPAADRLKQVTTFLPADLALILVHPPTYTPFLAEAGTIAATGDQACKDALRTAIANHPKSAVVDWRTDKPVNQNPGLFFDQTHYRQPIAQLVEEDIAATLRALGSGKR